jgi:hypothetical protein
MPIFFQSSRNEKEKKKKKNSHTPGFTTRHISLYHLTYFLFLSSPLAAHHESCSRAVGGTLTVGIGVAAAAGMVMMRGGSIVGFVGRGAAAAAAAAAAGTMVTMTTMVLVMGGSIGGFVGRGAAAAAAAAGTMVTMTTMVLVMGGSIDLVGIDLVGIDLVGIDLVGIDLVGIDPVAGRAVAGMPVGLAAGMAVIVAGAAVPVRGATWLLVPLYSASPLHFSHEPLSSAFSGLPVRLSSRVSAHSPTLLACLDFSRGTLPGGVDDLPEPCGLNPRTSILAVLEDLRIKCEVLPRIMSCVALPTTKKFSFLDLGLESL